ncbi:thermonuclease family protein, partial [Staphylococcus pasteuri]
LAQEGLARAKFYPPNDKYRILIEQAQKEAQKKQLNIWER